MKREKLYLSTIDPRAYPLAKTYGLGVEIAEFCTAWNMDSETVREELEAKLTGIPRRLFHGPFNELFPCAIDPLARKLSEHRFRQAASLAEKFGGTRLILHGGYNPRIYYRQWYVEQSIEFWKEFLAQAPGVEIVLENVLEEEPSMLLEIVQGVDHPGLGLCLDVGHVNAYSQVPAAEWIRQWSARLRHFHIHNNDGTWDTHSPLDQGTLPIRALLEQAQTLCPDATFTLELPDAEASVKWLLE